MGALKRSDITCGRIGVDTLAQLQSGAAVCTVSGVLVMDQKAHSLLQICYTDLSIF